jgi:hypothetical protein
MTLQSDNNRGHGLANNLVAQMGLLAVVVVILLLVAWHYIW